MAEPRGGSGSYENGRGAGGFGEANRSEIEQRRSVGRRAELHDLRVTSSEAQCGGVLVLWSVVIVWL